MRDRRGETLFIDAHKLGYTVNAVHRDLSDENIALLANTYHCVVHGEGLVTDSPLRGRARLLQIRHA